MSKFEERVMGVVDPKFDEFVRLFQSAPGKPSLHDVDDIFDLVEKLFNLVKDVKTEVNKTERQTTPEEEREPKKKKQPTKDDLKQLWDILTDDDPHNLLQMLDWLLPYYVPKSLPDVPPGIDVGDSGLLEWIVDQPDNGLSKLVISKIITTTISKMIDRTIDNTNSKFLDSKSFDAASKEEIKNHVTETVDNCCTEMGLKLKDLSDDMEECCTTMQDKIDGTQDTANEINHKVDLLDPVTNANNVLEILQRVKAMQSSMDEFRRLL